MRGRTGTSTSSIQRDPKRKKKPKYVGRTHLDVSDTPKLSPLEMLQKHSTMRPQSRPE